MSSAATTANTSCIESANPSSTTWRTASGSVAITELSLSDEALLKRSTTACGRPAARARSWMLPASEPNRMASDTAAPSVPPSERKNVTDDVATPMSAGGRAFCTAMTRVCIDRPRPMPIRTMYVIACHSGVSTPSVDISTRARNIRAVPAIGRGL